MSTNTDPENLKIRVWNVVLKFAILLSLTLLITTSYFLFIFSAEFEKPISLIGFFKTIQYFSFPLSFATSVSFLFFDYLIESRIKNKIILLTVRFIFLLTILYIAAFLSSGYFIVNTFFNPPF